MNETYKNLLTEFVRFKSVSTDVAFKEDIVATAQWLHNLFESRDFNTQTVIGYGNPIVIARYSVDESLPTCLIYGHYDVQPAEIEDGWNSDPFELTERDERLYARGVLDNKGQVLIHIATVFELIESHKLKYNVAFMIEGDEETGSARMADFFADHKALIQSDFVLISDGEMGDTPTIEAGFRGGINMELTLRTADTDVHSGIYGGIIPNPVHELAMVLSNMFTKDNRIAIPGFYDDVLPISQELHELYADVPFDEEDYYARIGAKTVLSEQGVHPLLQIGLRPTLHVSGINAGYTGDGYRNSIPATATVKMNLRLVDNQDSEKISLAVKDFVAQTLPEYVDYTFEVSDPYPSIILNTKNDYTQEVCNSLERVYNKKPLFVYCGGSLPIVELYVRDLGVPVISASLGNDDGKMHAPNENFNLAYIERGLAFSRDFFSSDRF